MPKPLKEETNRRKAIELCQFNSIAAWDDLVLLGILLDQEMRRQDRPSERMMNAREIVERLKKYNKEIKDELL